MYDEDPILFVAGASGLTGAGTGLAFTGASTMIITIAAVAAIVLGVLCLRLAAWSMRRVRSNI
jgi:hypothetical protein